MIFQYIDFDGSKKITLRNIKETLKKQGLGNWNQNSLEIWSFFEDHTNELDYQNFYRIIKDIFT